MSQKTKQEPAGVFTKIAECLYRNASSGTYYALVKRSGKQFRKSLKTTDPALAKRRLVDYRAKVARLAEDTGDNHVLFGEWADRWLETVRGSLKPSSAKRREVSINQLKHFFDTIPVRNISSRDCDDWVIKRGGDEISASTFNNERETLRLILDHACRDGILLDNPAIGIKRRKLAKTRIVIPTQGQFRALVEMIRRGHVQGHAGADLVELLAYSGMRLAEATSLLWGDVDFERNCFTVTGGETGTKNHEARTVPLFPALAKLLERLRDGTAPKATDRVIPIDNAKEGIKKACKESSLPHFSHHTMRHYFVSNAIEAGVDFKVIAGWVGHKDGGVLVAKTYGHLRDAHSFEMAKRMTFSAVTDVANG